MENGKPRLAIHIGYPKTATTTLQVNLLYSLHQQGRLNYLGTRQKIGDGWIRTTDSFLAAMLRRQEFGPGLSEALSVSHPYLDGLLCEDRPNVWSSEYLSLPGKDVRPLHEIPHALRRAFGDGVDYAIFLTVREQTSLLASYYAHFFKHAFYLTRDTDTVNKWLENHILRADAENDSGGLFDFNRLIDPWVATFGEDRIHVSVFEDIRQNLDDHLRSWQVYLALPQGEAEALWGQKQAQRVRQKGRGAYKRHVELDLWLRKHLRLPVSGENSSSVGMSLLRAAGRRLPGRTVTLDEISDANKARIKQRYAESNRWFASRFTLSEQRMQDYGYL